MQGSTTGSSHPQPHTERESQKSPHLPTTWAKASQATHTHAPSHLTREAVPATACMGSQQKFFLLTQKACSVLLHGPVSVLSQRVPFIWAIPKGMSDNGKMKFKEEFRLGGIRSYKRTTMSTSNFNWLFCISVSLSVSLSPPSLSPNGDRIWPAALAR